MAFPLAVAGIAGTLGVSAAATGGASALAVGNLAEGFALSLGLIKAGHEANIALAMIQFAASMTQKAGQAMQSAAQV